MDIAQLLLPYITDLTATQLELVSKYLEILLRWNARMNLTAVRDPEQIVIRHFGESFFLARHLPEVTNGVIDVGSGAGFPGIPLKIARPDLTLTLIEGQQRKAVFLREVLRALNLDAEVKNARAEQLAFQADLSADLVTFRAVEKFNDILPVAASLVRKGSPGKLALLIGSAQATQARNLLETWHFDPEIPVPGSQNRIILFGNQVN
jgi:16S rRNA (guanine527-N7)-methyltransferase